MLTVSSSPSGAGSARPVAASTKASGSPVTSRPVVRNRPGTGPDRRGRAPPGPIPGRSGCPRCGRRRPAARRRRPTAGRPRHGCRRRGGRRRTRAPRRRHRPSSRPRRGPALTTHPRRRRRAGWPRGRTPRSSSAITSPAERARRSATWRSVTSGVPRPSNSPDPTAVRVAATWATRSPVLQPTHRVGARQPASSSDRASSAKAAISSLNPLTTSSRGSVIVRTPSEK